MQIEGCTETKIGFAKNVYGRLQIFKTHNPKTVHCIAVKELDETTSGVGLEKKIHEIFKNKRVKNEWFDLSPEDIKILINDFGFKKIKNNNLGPRANKKGGANLFAISKKSEAIAKKYGPNVSQGIAEMEQRLEKYRMIMKNNRYSGEVE